MVFRDELQKRLEKKRNEINTLAGKLKEAQIYAQALEDTLKLLPKEDGASEVPDETTLREGSTISRAKEVLQKEGRPMHISELLMGLGKPADKEHRAALAGSLGAYVRRGDIFTRPRPNTFGLVGMKVTSAQADAPPLTTFQTDQPPQEDATEEPDFPL